MATVKINGKEITVEENMLSCPQFPFNLNKRPLMPRTKHLFSIFSLTLIFVSPVWSVDFNCPGGTWVLVSSNTYCPNIPNCGATIISGGTKRVVQSIAGCFASSGSCGLSTCKFEILASTPCYGCSNFPQFFYGECTVSESIYEWKCPCTAGQTQACSYSGPAGTENVGICRAGSKTCQGGYWAACEGEVLPQTEICGDGIDNNCDGQVDEGCAVCTEGDTQACSYSGPAGTENVGICKAGTKTCVNGQWGSCQGEVTPQTETCGDGVDNNCNGQIDEGCGIELPETVYQCEEDIKNAQYDRIDKTICNSGCSLASITMILNYYLAKNNLPMVDILDLNKWLNENDGWDKETGPRGRKIRDYPDETKFVVTYDESRSLNIGKLGNKEITKEYLTQVLESELTSGHPVILKVNNNSHSVVAVDITTKDGVTTYTIIDPGHNTEQMPQKTTLKERYGNTFYGIRIYLPRTK